ncbi:MAG: hypothetical protein LBU90_06100 [Bacteroidales bacterium]|jgi:antitoxin component YwqK of YwqJK toxin-antitoxin module|nr:hypothetical protein [Bacteroidales bacterium]
MSQNFYSLVKQSLFVCVCCCTVPLLSFAQPKGDQINYVDANNKKQGLWIKRDAQGVKLYEGTFKNDVPVGEFKRFHPNGTVKQLMLYSSENPLEVAVQTFNEQGVLVAQGNFYNQKKHGAWQYFENKQLIAEDMYDNGVLDGTSTIYWQTTPHRQTAEIKNWTQGKKDGAWLWFYESGQVRMNANYANNTLHGKFTVYFANGATMLSGVYKHDRRDGDWTYKNEDGSTKLVLKYANGKMLNQDEFDKEQTRQLNEQWSNVPDFAEPDMNNPELAEETSTHIKDPNDPSNYVDNPEEFVMREMAPGVDFDAQQENPNTKKQKSAKNTTKLK